MIGYRLKRESQGERWLFLGTTSAEVSRGIKDEIDSDAGLGVDEIDKQIIEPVEISQQEIDEMPDFQGW